MHSQSSCSFGALRRCNVGWKCYSSSWRPIATKGWSIQPHRSRNCSISNKRCSARSLRKARRSLCPYSTCGRRGSAHGFCWVILFEGGSCWKEGFLHSELGQNYPKRKGAPFQLPSINFEVQRWGVSFRESTPPKFNIDTKNDFKHGVILGIHCGLPVPWSTLGIRFYEGNLFLTFLMHLRKITL